MLHAQDAATGHAAKHKLLVISVDGLDWRYLRDRDAMGEQIPNLRRIMSRSEVADGVTGVWPTITWPSHTSIITGMRPDQHGIAGNRKPKDEGGDYYWSAHLIRTPTLLTCAASQGLTSATVTWPVTLDAPVTYNLPEFFSRRNGGSMDMESVAGKAMPATLPAEISKDFPSFPQQWMDDRTRTLAAVWLLEHKQPDLMLVHLVDLDSDQHDLGPFNSSSRAIVERTDELIGQMMAAMRPDYDLVITSDHGFERVDFVADLRVLLQQHGIPGEVTSLGGVAWTKDQAVADFLRSESGAGKDKIGRIISKEELSRYAPRLSSALLAVEPASHVLFGYDVPGHDRPADRVNPATQPVYLSPPAEKGNHGFWPTRQDYGSVYMLYGPGVSGKTLPRMQMIDIKDRLAAVLGIRCP